MRLVAGVLLAAAVLLGGCAGWYETPCNPEQACDIAGGFLAADGRRLAGNSSQAPTVTESDAWS